MIEKTTRIELKNLTAIDVSNFMINCTDAEYQEWWPDVHLAFHTMKRFPREVGNLVFFDEYTGKRRLRFMAFVTEFIAGKKVVWQLKSLISLPVWITLEFQQAPDGLIVYHRLAVGYRVIGKLLDPFLKLFLTHSFQQDLEEHVQTEFELLAKKFDRNSTELE